MSSVSPSPSESSMIASTSSISCDIDDETKNTFRSFKALSKVELADLIEKCKDMICQSEEMSSQRKWLIRRLIELRFRLAHINALREDISDDDLAVSGHNFRVLKKIPSKRFLCDWCTNTIWIFQHCYSCLDCFYTCHIKCLKYVTRLCAHTTVCEKGRPELRICPEVGLSMQMYRCAECSIQLMNKLCFLEPKKDYYSGLFFCKNCHWQNLSIIPANIVHNWDFEQRLVSRQSLQEINLFYERPVIKLEEINPKLFVFVQKLGKIRQQRINLMEMKRYLDVCKFALASKVIDKATGTRRYLVQNTDFYSIYDLVCVENSSLSDYLKNLFVIFKQHIINCVVRKISNLIEFHFYFFLFLDLQRTRLFL